MLRASIAAAAATASWLALATAVNAAQLVISSGATLELGASTLDLACGDVLIAGTLLAGTNGLVHARDLSISSGGTLDGDSASIEVAGDWTRSGTFNPGTGTVAFVDGCATSNSTIFGANSFNNLSLTTTTGKQMFFESGQTTSVDDTLSLGGTFGNLLVLRSTQDGSEAFLNVAGSGSGDFVEVQDIHAVGQLVALGPNSVVSGNAPGWHIAALVPALGLLGLVALAWSLQRAGRRALRTFT